MKIKQICNTATDKILALMEDGSLWYAKSKGQLWSEGFEWHPLDVCPSVDEAGTLEELLRHSDVKGEISGEHYPPKFEISVQHTCDSGGLRVVIHPVGVDGVTRDYIVRGNHLQRVG